MPRQVGRDSEARARAAADLPCHPQWMLCGAHHFAAASRRDPEDRLDAVVARPGDARGLSTGLVPGRKDEARLVSSSARRTLRSAGWVASSTPTHFEAVVAGVDNAVPVAHNHVGDLALAGPPELAETVGRRIPPGRAGTALGEQQVSRCSEKGSGRPSFVPRMAHLAALVASDGLHQVNLTATPV